MCILQGINFKSFLLFFLFRWIKSKWISWVCRVANVQSLESAFHSSKCKKTLKTKYKKWRYLRFTQVLFWVCSCCVSFSFSLFFSVCSSGSEKFRWWIVSFLYFLLLGTISTALTRARATFIIAVTTKLWKYEQILKVFLFTGTQNAYGIYGLMVIFFKVNTIRNVGTFLQHSTNALAMLAQTWQIKTHSTISLHSNVFQCLSFICRIVGRQLPMEMTEWCRSVLCWTSNWVHFHCSREREDK